MAIVGRQSLGLNLFCAIGHNSASRIYTQAVYIVASASCGRCARGPGQPCVWEYIQSDTGPPTDEGGSVEEFSAGRPLLLTDITKGSSPSKDASYGSQDPMENGVSNSKGNKLMTYSGAQRPQFISKRETLPEKCNASFVKVSMASPDEPALQLRSQIQHYATNELGTTYERFLSRLM